MGGILLSGYFGFGNSGDEAILEATIKAFRTDAPHLPLQVLVPSPGAVPPREGVRFRERGVGRELFEAIRESDLVLSGGGGLIQDSTSFGSLCYYLGVLEAARRLGRRTMIFAQGVGPLRRPVSRWLTRLVVNRTDRVTVRDDESAALLREIGVRAPVAVTADPVFLLPPPSRERGEALLAELGVEADETTLVGGVVRQWNGAERIVAALAAGLAGWGRKIPGARVIVIPLELPGDRRISERVADGLAGKVPAVLVTRTLPPSDLAALLGRMRLVVSMRLHALIFAALGGVPFLGLAYDPKVTAFCRRFGQPVLSLEGVTPGGVEQGLADLWRGLEENRGGIANSIALCRSLALDNVRMALQLLQ